VHATTNVYTRRGCLRFEALLGLRLCRNGLRSDEGRDVGLDDLLDLGLGLRCDVARRDLLQQRLLRTSQMRAEVGLPSRDLVDGDLIQQTVDTGVDDRHLDLGRQRLVLPLLEELGQTGATAEQEASRGVEIGTELGECGDFTVLGEVQLERTGELLHDLGLGRRADTRDRETDVDGRANTTEEELSLQEDLAVSDGNDLQTDCQNGVENGSRRLRTLVGM